MMNRLMKLVMMLTVLACSGCISVGGVRQVDWPRVCDDLKNAESVARDFRGLTKLGSDEYKALQLVVEYVDEASTLACSLAEDASRQARVQSLLREGLRIAERLIDELDDEEKKRQAKLAVIIIKVGLRRAGFQLE